MLTMTSRFPSGRTMANDPSKVPDFCSVRYQNVESRNGSPSLTMTTASISSLAFEMSLSALVLGMPLNYNRYRNTFAWNDPGHVSKGGGPAVPDPCLLEPQMPIHSFLTILFRAEMADIAAR